MIDSFQVVYEGILLRCLTQLSNKIIYCQWFATSSIPSDELFRQEVTRCFELICSTGCGRVLDNSVKVNYPILPELQEWVAAYMQRIANDGYLTKYAIVMPEDMIAELSNEQIIDEVSQTQQDGKALAIHNFFNDDEALKWLLS